MMRLDAIPAFAQRVLEQANSLLIVCNKKSEAAYLYKALSNGTAHCFHLSAAMCMAHRSIDRSPEKIQNPVSSGFFQK